MTGRLIGGIPVGGGPAVGRILIGLVLALVLVHRALIVRRLHLDVGRRFRVLIHRLVVLVLSHNGAGNRQYQTQKCGYEFEFHQYLHLCNNKAVALTMHVACQFLSAGGGLSS